MDQNQQNLNQTQQQQQHVLVQNGNQQQQQQQQNQQQQQKQQIKQQKKIIQGNQNQTIEKYYPNKLCDFSYLHKYGYNIYEELGRGGYGVVYKACLIKGGKQDKSQKFAIKINFQTVSTELITTEISFLRLVQDYQSMPQFVDLVYENGKVHLIMKYFKYQPFIQYFSSFSMLEIKYYIFELLKATKSLKDLGIIHRDIKPANFLYNPSQRKGILIDFGLSEIDEVFLIQQEANLKRLQQNQFSAENQERVNKLKEKVIIYKEIKSGLEQIGKNKIGTESFMPIESILRSKYQTYKVDIWPIGIIFLQFLLNKFNIFNSVRMINKPNDIKNPFIVNFIFELREIFGSEQTLQTCNNLGYKIQFPFEEEKPPVDWRNVINKQGFDDNAYDLLNRMLCMSQDRRISVEEALSHPFFEEIQ